MEQGGARPPGPQRSADEVFANRPRRPGEEEPSDPNEVFSRRPRRPGSAALPTSDILPPPNPDAEPHPDTRTGFWGRVREMAAGTYKSTISNPEFWAYTAASTTINQGTKIALISAGYSAWWAMPVVAAGAAGINYARRQISETNKAYLAMEGKEGEKASRLWQINELKRRRQEIRSSDRGEDILNEIKKKAIQGAIIAATASIVGGSAANSGLTEWVGHQILDKAVWVKDALAGMMASGPDIPAAITATPDTTSATIDVATETPTTVPTITNTPVPATVTETAVPPTIIETPIPTKTPEPLTNTPTSLPTNTQVPTSIPTSTPTNTPTVEPSPTRPPWMKIVPSDQAEYATAHAPLDQGEFNPDAKQSFFMRQGLEPEVNQALINNAPWPADVEAGYRQWGGNLSDVSQAKLAELVNTAPEDPVNVSFPTSLDPLRATVPGPDGVNYPSLEGKVQALYADHLFIPMHEELKDIIAKNHDPGALKAALEQYKVSHKLTGFFFNIDKALEEIGKTGKFDPYNADHLEILKKLKQDANMSDQEFNGRANALYAFAKKHTPLDRFHPQYPDGVKLEGFKVPAQLNEQGGWWDKVEELAKDKRTP